MIGPPQPRRTKSGVLGCEPWPVALSRTESTFPPYQPNLGGCVLALGRKPSAAGMDTVSTLAVEAVRIRGGTLTATAVMSNTVALAVAQLHASHGAYLRGGRKNVDQCSMSDAPSRAPRVLVSTSADAADRPAGIPMNWQHSTTSERSAAQSAARGQRTLKSARAMPSGRKSAMLLSTSVSHISPHAKHQAGGTRCAGSIALGVSVAHAMSARAPTNSVRRGKTIPPARWRDAATSAATWRRFHHAARSSDCRSACLRK